MLREYKAPKIDMIEPVDVILASADVGGSDGDNGSGGDSGSGSGDSFGFVDGGILG
jgi:hypothetical protein